MYKSHSFSANGSRRALAYTKMQHSHMLLECKMVGPLKKNSVPLVLVTGQFQLLFHKYILDFDVVMPVLRSP